MQSSRGANLDTLSDMFQFPFRRDVLCNNEKRCPEPGTQGVSIPFSSGCALQSSQPNPLEIRYTRFNSLFVGMCFAILPDDDNDIVKFRFNSLFVGMCFAISVYWSGGHKDPAFQFPFRRDVLCNPSGPWCREPSRFVSIPFSSGCALQSQRRSSTPALLSRFNSLFVGMCFAIFDKEYGGGANISFNSLFVGMCFAIAYPILDPGKSHISFNSLFVGMCFAMDLSGFSNTAKLSFNSLFVGMCFAIAAIRGHALVTGVVSIPFSSGCALQ